MRRCRLEGISVPRREDQQLAVGGRDRGELMRGPHWPSTPGVVVRTARQHSDSIMAVPLPGICNTHPGITLPVVPLGTPRNSTSENLSTGGFPEYGRSHFDVHAVAIASAFWIRPWLRTRCPIKAAAASLPELVVRHGATLPSLRRKAWQAGSNREASSCPRPRIFR